MESSASVGRGGRRSVMKDSSCTTESIRGSSYCQRNLSYEALTARSLPMKQGMKPDPPSSSLLDLYDRVYGKGILLDNLRLLPLHNEPPRRRRDDRDVVSAREPKSRRR